MKFLCCFLFCFLLLGRSVNANKREKRFLRSGFLNPLQDRLSGLGDLARDLSEQISSQATAVVHSLAPHAAQAASDFSSFSRQMGQSVRQGFQKRGLAYVPPIERETEGEGEKDADVPEPGHEEASEPLRPGLGLFGLGLFRPWWQGPNICEEKNVIEEPNPEDEATDGGMKFSFMTTRCVPSQSAYVCTRETKTETTSTTVVTKKQCCHGFIRRSDGRPGCSALKMENLLDTIKDLKMDKFLKWIENTEFEEQFKNENMTVFVPSNEAIVDFEDESNDNEISAINPVRRLIDPASIVQAHLADEFHNVDLLDSEHLLDTKDKESKIRINKYQVAHKIVTANCVPLSGRNNFAKNGIVHLVSGVLPRPKMTIKEILENGKEYETFRNLLDSNGLLDDMAKDDQPRTLFVPTNEAFKNLPKNLRRQIESGSGCVHAILQQHISKGTVCSAAIVSQSGVRNSLDNLLRLTRDEAERLRVDGARVTTQDVMATNGVIHVIDEVLVPPQARNLLKALEEEDRQDILALIQIADMKDDFEKSGNFTFLIPTKDAFKNLPNETMDRLANDSEFVKTFLKHHLIQSHASSKTFMQTPKLTNLNGQDIHVHVHEMFPGIVGAVTIQCAYVVRQDEKACGTLIHKVNKVLMPPKGTIVETLKDMKDHEIIFKLLQASGLEEKLSEKGPFTLLAPTDEAFERMDEETLKNLMENSTMAEDVIKLHVLPEILCCNGVSPATPLFRQFVRTLGGGILPAHKGLGMDRVRFGRARVTQCDVPATNGLVHSINRVILPERPVTDPIFRFNIFPML